MPDNEHKADDISSNPIYQAILEKLKAQDEKIANMSKTLDDVTGFNKALLSRSPSQTSSSKEDAEAKLKSYLSEN